MEFLKDAHRVGRMPLSLWFAWGLFAYVVIPFLFYVIVGSSNSCYYGHCTLEYYVLRPSFYYFADDAAFSFFAVYRGPASLLLAFILSVYGGWRGVRKYGTSIKTVFATGVLGGVLMATLFVGGTMVLKGYSNFFPLFGAIASLSLFLAVFASIGAFAAKEVG